MDSKTAIAWIDLKLKFRSVLTQKEVTVLNGISGSADFGSITAVMGPSGAGLTSLMMCLNGMHSTRLGKETEIRLNCDTKIRSAFIGHNEKEFLIMGLTANQNMVYASRLKNSYANEDIDHQKNVSTIMSELLITDTMHTKAKDCSGGEQKRLAIGLELTALNKPNLIFFDEPTTGLDSNVADVVMKCLKELSVLHNISIVMTIHQPNTGIVEMFDSLYVLAKGGVCVYSGPPEELNNHLRDCNIICNENQVPIENLVTIGAKGTDDQRVIALKDKTNKELKYCINNRINETKVKRLNAENKRFHLKDIHILLSRAVAEIYSYKWQTYAINSSVTLLMSLFLALSVDPDVGDYDDCFTLGQPSNISCIEQLDADYHHSENIVFFILTIWVTQLLICIQTIAEMIKNLKLFSNERQNS